MKAIVLVCLGLVIFNVVSSTQVLEAEKLLKYIIENAKNNEDGGLSARLLYSLGKSKQKSSSGPTQTLPGYISSKARQIVKKQRIQPTLALDTPIAPSQDYYAPAPPQRVAPPPAPTYSAPAPPQRVAPPPVQTYVPPPPPPQRVAPPPVQTYVPPPQTYVPPPPPQRVAPPAPTYGGSAYGGSYGTQRSNGFQRDLVGGCIDEQINVLKQNPLTLEFETVVTYCHCVGNTYSLNGCQQSFINPCSDGGDQFEFADVSFGPQFFIHCDRDMPYLKTCPASLVWNANLVTCAWNADDGQEATGGNSSPNLQENDQPPNNYGGYGGYGGY